LVVYLYSKATAYQKEAKDIAGLEILFNEIIKLVEKKYLFSKTLIIRAEEKRSALKKKAQIYLKLSQNLMYKRIFLFTLIL